MDDNIMKNKSTGKFLSQRENTNYKLSAKIREKKSAFICEKHS